jgi:hypothetical protein
LKRRGVRRKWKLGWFVIDNDVSVGLGGLIVLEESRGRL